MHLKRRIVKQKKKRIEGFEKAPRAKRAEKSGREPNTAGDALAKRSEEKLLKKLSKNFEKRS